MYARRVRVLLTNNHCISDPTTGATLSLRTIAQWLADAGHDCRALTTARLDRGTTITIDEHLGSLGVTLPARRRGSSLSGVPRVRYSVGSLPITLLLTRHNDEARPDRGEARDYADAVAQLLDEFRPDLLIACNGHPMIGAAMQVARRRGVVTTFTLRSFGYDSRSYFEHADHVFTCSQFLTDHYRERVGIASTPLEPPIDWATVVAPTEARAFVTFVHPAPHKGLYLFARLADLLGARRPDIPLLVVQSGHTAGSLNGIPGLDFSRYPQIMAAPAVPTPSDYFALTRVLVVPSVWHEPFGRVAAEAMINRVPAVVSDRGSLPHVVGGDEAHGGGGLVRPVPGWMQFDTTRVPDTAEVEPWFDAVCRLWDDAAYYDRVAARAFAIASERYSEDVSRRRHVDYFTSLGPSANAGVSHAD